MGLISMVMFALRFFAFTLYESPKFLMGRGRDEKAVETVHKIAKRNKKTSSLTVEELVASGESFGGKQAAQGTDARAVLKRRLEKVNLEHVRALFRTRKLAFSTSIITVVWAFIGLGFPLYNAFLPYLQLQKGAEIGDASVNITYRNSVIIAVLGIPGAVIGGVLVELPKFGRKGALSVSTVLTGVFLFAGTTSLTSNAFLGWNCAYSFMSNVMYAVLYAYTPEVSHDGRRKTQYSMSSLPSLFLLRVPRNLLMSFSRCSQPEIEEQATQLPPQQIGFLVSWHPLSLYMLISQRPSRSTLAVHYSSSRACWSSFCHSSQMGKQAYDVNQCLTYQLHDRI